ncbi:hypothetical protein L2D08_04370 [Domibacillus sp. PGB-M46]|uniref:hypothetical protein n=1 Tax=Domibacillus sp. PGB-M46 TaxID=2910255 RepID=UPI001F566A3E|nr:hypothetical protein [Domibacillus sp. PGB-M46]MCI2253593.1 hypothetical protein [Domibacillus sp. PGB-M46]
MYFSNVEHKNNFHLLMAKYNLELGEDAEYECNLYLCSYPKIFNCIEDINNIDLSRSPLYEFTYWDIEREKYVVSAPELTGSTRRMVEIGLSCYNSFPVGLDDAFGSINDEELIKIVFTTMKIRLGVIAA